MRTSGLSYGHLKPSYCRRWTFSGFGSNFEGDAKIFGMSKKFPRRPHDGAFSRWIRESFFPFVRPSWWHLVGSCSLRLLFVWSSVSSGHFFASRRQYDGNKKVPDCPKKATRLRETFALPSWSLRNKEIYSTLTSRSDQGVYEDDRLWVA